MIRPAAGLYPSHLDLDAAKKMIDLIRKEQAVLAAIGEVGLDFWLAKAEEQRELQKEIFKKFIRLSLELDLPLNVHSRSAGRHAIAALLENRAPKVQLHAFDGKPGSAMPGVEAGYFFSVPPSVVRSRQKQKLVKQLPLSCLLLETDSPVLGPEPRERNVPANILIAARTVSEIKGITQDEVLERALHNTQTLYS
jgi:TatD DNase family protein